MISRFVEPVSRSDGIFDFLAIPAKQVSGMGMIFHFLIELLSLFLIKKA